MARQTLRATAVHIGALVFANFVTVTGATAERETWVPSLNLSATALTLKILAPYVRLGC